MSGYVIHGLGDLAEPPRETLVEFLAGLNDAPWVSDALCAQVDTEIWFPTKHAADAEDSAQQFILQAKGVCGRCPVRSECLQYALDNDEAHGIWGGTVPRERRRMKAGEDLPARPCAREACTETIPNWASAKKRYHDKDCARIANEDRMIARLDKQAVVDAYLAGGISQARLASRHKVTGNVIARVLDEHHVRRRRGGSRVRPAKESA